MCLYSNLIWVIFVLRISSCHSCDKREDVTYVKSCPKTIDEWKAAAEKKNCMYNHDNCPLQEDQPLVYHCVKYRFEPKFVEVCSKVYKSQGQCVDFDPSRKMVTSNFYKNCTTCPEIYNSTDIFKFPECYGSYSGAKPFPTPTTASDTPNGTSNWVVIYIVVTPALLLIILGVVLTVLIIQIHVLGCCRARRVVNRRVEDVDTESNELTNLQRY